MTTPRIEWPDGKKFAFTIFDDPDGQSLAQTQEVYDFLADLGMRTTIGVWSVEPGPERRNSTGETCRNEAYLRTIRGFQDRGFEIGFHSAGPASLTRSEIAAGLDYFRECFGADPTTMANHYNADAIYWGAARLSGINRAVYDLATLGRQQQFAGHLPGHPSFWGDLCRDRIRYCRNFVFRELNTLKACPMMPYHDPDRPFVNQWYASAEAANIDQALELMTEAACDRLEEEGGAAILYTHFAHGFFDSGGLSSRFRAIMTRLARKNGWFVPVKTLLGFLERQGNGGPIAPGERARLERRWLKAKLLHGTS